MSYRVEIAASGRAICVATDCKKNKIKIDKGELRLGVWVEIEGKGSYKWKHWGCVTGFQLFNMREYLGDHDNPGSYHWDMLDGYDGEDKNSLEHHPALQEKVRRVITQGFIDPEDFNGDPEMNVLGEKGLRTPASKKKQRDEEKKKAEEANGEGQEHPPTPAKASKKRVKDEDDDDAEETKPAKKKRATKAKKEEDSDEESKPVKKSRAKKVKPEQDEEINDEESKPAPVKKSRAKKAKKEEDADIVKHEEDQDASAITAPKKKPAGRKKAVKEEEADESNDIGEPSELKTKAKRGRKKAVKEEHSEDDALATGAEGSTIPTEFDESTNVKGEPSEAVGLASAAPVVGDIDAQIAVLKDLDFSDVSLPAQASKTKETVIPGIKDFDLQNMVAEGVESGEIDDTSLVAFLQSKRDEVIAELEKRKKKGSRAKKGASAKSGRASRSRTASKN